MERFEAWLNERYAEDNMAARIASAMARAQEWCAMRYREPDLFAIKAEAGEKMLVPLAADAAFLQLSGVPVYELGAAIQAYHDYRTGGALWGDEWLTDMALVRENSFRGWLTDKGSGPAARDMLVSTIRGAEVYAAKHRQRDVKLFGAGKLAEVERSVCAMLLDNSFAAEQKAMAFAFRNASKKYLEFAQQFYGM